MNIYDPIFDRLPFLEEHRYNTIHGRKTVRVSIWRYHFEVDCFVTNSVVKARHWIVDNGYDYMYDYGDCMIYVFINDVRIKYYSLMNKTYIIDL